MITSPICIPSRRWPALRLPVLASLCVLAVLAGPLSTRADAQTDTSQLPRASVAKQIYASPATTIFTSTLSVQATAEAIIKSLAAQGWQSYEAPFTAKSENPAQAILSFKKGPQALSVFISIAPAQNNATSVQYNAAALKTDLPFPKDATAILFSPDRPYLKCMMTGSLEYALDFFGKELVAQGWSAWSRQTASKLLPGEPITEIKQDSGFAYFIRDGKPPVRLSLYKSKAGETIAEIEPIDPDELDPKIAREKDRIAKEKQAAEMDAARKKAQEDFTQRQSRFDNMAADIIKQAMQAPPVTVTPPPANSSKPLAAMEGGKAPVPVPEGAENVEYKGDSGQLDFRSSSSVAALAAFYRSAMTPLGWKEQKSVINRPNMVVLNFLRDRKEISFTIMQMGAASNVSARGAGLEGKSESGSEPAGSAEAAQKLEAEDKYGLPIPTPNTLSETSQTPYRIEARATIATGIADAIAFFRSELTKRNWKEDEKSAAISADRAIIAFTAPEGAGKLTISRKGKDTNILLVLRKQEDARKAGLLPAPGKVKILISSMLETESTITLDRKTIKVGAGVGMKNPDGPTLELAPGKYRAAIKTAGKPERSEQIEVEADSVWGLIIGPGGALPLQVY